MRWLAGNALRSSAPALCLALLAGACGSSARVEQPPQRLVVPPPLPQLMFVSVASDDTFHRVGVASLATPGGSVFVTPLSCERVYFGGHRGICLTSSVTGATTSWWAEIFDEHFAPLRRVPLTGSPSRVRVSPDGRLAASTVFESGHSYAEHGFSTRTTIIDMDAAAALADLEQFETWRDGSRVRSDDFNFWGVTFASDGDTFYATLDTAGVSYLVRGSVRGRRMDIVHAGVECPSLSPDNARIAFKKGVGARSLGWWRIVVLQLDTMTESAVTRETRSVDDQVEWLDADRVMYHLTGGASAADLWAVRVDDSAAPERLRSSAYSPTVVRASTPAH